jgi:hypothetical protein
MSVAANVKQVLTIVLYAANEVYRRNLADFLSRAVLIFDLSINGVNLIGIASTICGGAWYSYIEYQSKTKSGPIVGASISSQPMLPTHSASSVLSEKDSPYAFNEKPAATPKKSLYDAMSAGNGKVPSSGPSSPARRTPSAAEDRLHRRTTSMAGGGLSPSSIATVHNKSTSSFT